MSSSLASLQAEIRRSDLSAFLVPRADAYGGESIAPRDERLRWLTGFTGSAGLCVATRSKAAIFVDGRYQVQVVSEVNLQELEIKDIQSQRLSDWLKEALPDGGLIGYDPWLHKQRDIERLASELEATGMELLSSGNLVDRIWADQPEPRNGRIFLHEVRFAGEPHRLKRERIASEIKRMGCTTAIVAAPDCICWLLNIRGSDVEGTPVVHAFAIVHSDRRVDLFLSKSNLRNVGNAVRNEMGKDVLMQPIGDLGRKLSELKGKVLADPGSCPAWIFERLVESGADIITARDPCILAKSIKNDREIECAAKAHIRDGAAMAETLAWLQLHGSRGTTELDVVNRIREFRERTGLLHELSFGAIAASGPNGAIVHYRATPKSNRTLDPEAPLLIDCGAQYKDGTTDVTRTVSLGCKDAEVMRCFTLVLKGLIAISRAQWPEGLTGRDLDPIARYPLWLAGMDYAHGTGHGVGHFLNVHEGPQAISRRSEEPLRAGMIVSLEPGFYRESEFGIRLENLAVIEAAPETDSGYGQRMLRFQTLTLVPIQKQMVLADDLSPDELSWLDGYHAETFAKVAPHCSPGTREWLERECSPIYASSALSCAPRRKSSPRDR